MVNFNFSNQWEGRVDCRTSDHVPSFPPYKYGYTIQK